jgi:hypothetical protein
VCRAGGFNVSEAGCFHTGTVPCHTVTHTEYCEKVCTMMHSSVTVHFNHSGKVHDTARWKGSITIQALRWGHRPVRNTASDGQQHGQEHLAIHLSHSSGRLLDLLARGVACTRHSSPTLPKSPSKPQGPQQVPGRMKCGISAPICTWLGQCACVCACASVCVAQARCPQITALT